MLTAVIGILVLGTFQDLGQADAQTVQARPAVECAAHLMNDRARRNCLNDLLERANGQLDTSHASAREEAGEIDLDTGSMFQAASNLDTAQAAWISYRDAECARRGSLMFVSEASREEIVIDCQIALTRARSSELGQY